MISRRLLALVDRLALLAALALPLAALLALAIATLAAARLGGISNLLPLGTLLVLLLACDRIEVREPNRRALLHRLDGLTLHPQEAALFARLIRDPNPQRMAVAAFGPRLLGFVARLAWLLAALAVLLTLAALLPHLRIGPAPLAAALLALLAAARLHDAVVSRALAHLLVAAGERLLASATALSAARCSRINAAVLAGIAKRA